MTRLALDVRTRLGVLSKLFVLAMAASSLAAQDAAGPVSPNGPRPLTERGLENIVAFTRLLGYVRYFHPSDEAAQTDWEQFAVTGVREVEQASDANALADTFVKLFFPIAPTIRVYLSSSFSPPPMLPALPVGTVPTRTVMWEHVGVGTKSGDPRYHSTRAYKNFETSEASQAVPSIGEQFVAELGGGVSVAVPLAVYADATSTLPRALPVAKLERETYSAQDRATRLAGVALAWNVFQHFYPYFDVVQSDWPGALRNALSAAATDHDEQDFLKTLQRLVAGLHDGHGGVSFRGQTLAVPPFQIAWAEDRLVIFGLVGRDTNGLSPGDVIEKIDGRSVPDAVADAEQLISSATLGWKRMIVLKEILVGSPNSDVALEVTNTSGEKRSVTTRRTISIGELYRSGARHAGRPAKVAEVRPGIVYLDIDRVNDADIANALPDLERANGIIVDFRGYPHDVSNIMELFRHMTDQPLTSAQWHTPIVTRPDRKGMTFRMTRWSATEPNEPRFKAKIAFLTEGRTISYAESCMGIVEYYGLGEIVGEPTAGTNGNVNMFFLPGGYEILWTGMKVLKHDGSQHHGIGIRPTVPAVRTVKGIAEGRDEVLEKAVEVVSRR